MVVEDEKQPIEQLLSFFDKPYTFTKAISKNECLKIASTLENKNCQQLFDNAERIYQYMVNNQ